MASTVFHLSMAVIIFTMTIAIATLPTCADQKPCDADTTCHPGKEKLIVNTTVIPSPNHDVKETTYSRYELEVKNYTTIKPSNDEMETVISESTSMGAHRSIGDTAVMDLGALLDAGEDTLENSTPAAVDGQPTKEAGSQTHTSHGKTLATAAPPSPPRHTPPADEGAVSRLRNLSAEEKARRLIVAAKEGAVGEVETMLAAGADVRARDANTMTALQWGAARGHVEAVRRLLQAGAEVDARDSWQWTALHFAAKYGHPAVVQLLVAASADIDARQREMWTPLHFAAGYDHADVVQLLVAASADINARKRDMWTPLHLAAGYGRTDVVRMLVAASADIEARNRYGWSPLHLAVYNGHADAAAILLDAGADRCARDILGRTPVDFSRLGNNQRLIDMLT